MTQPASQPREVGPADVGRPRWRTPWLLIILLVLLVALPVSEVSLLVLVGRHIGVLPTLGILLVEAVLGAWLMKREGSRAWNALAAGVSSGTLPSGRLADAALILVGGTCLILPGLITDVLGLCFLLPFTRPFARRVLGWLVARQVHRRLGVRPEVLKARYDRSNTIDGEVIEPEAPGRTSTDDGPPAQLGH